MELINEEQRKQIDLFVDFAARSYVYVIIIGDL